MTMIEAIGPDINSQFEELKIAKRFPIIELKSVYGVSYLRDIVTTVGLGNVTNTNVEYKVSTSTSGVDFAILDSVEWGRYMPGFASQAGIGVRIPSNPIGAQIFRWGMFDNDNGAFFGWSASEGVFVAIRREGVDQIIPQSSWNIDSLDGTGPSTITLDLSSGNIFQITFTWYGYGVIQFDVVVQEPVTLAQKVVTVHRFKPSEQTSFTDPNLPLRAQVNNNDTEAEAELFIGGREYSIIGRFNPEFRITSERRTVSLETTRVPIISFQRKSNFPSETLRSNSVSVKLEGIDILTSSDVYFQIVVGGSLNTGFSNFPTDTTNIPNNETGLLVNNTATSITGGKVVFQGVAAGGEGSANRDIAKAVLLNFELPEFQSISLVVGTFSGSSLVTAVFRVTEEW